VQTGECSRRLRERYRSAEVTGDAVSRDVPPPMQDADWNAWLNALAELRKPKFPAQVIVPGRGAPSAGPQGRAGSKS